MFSKGNLYGTRSFLYLCSYQTCILLSFPSLLFMIQRLFSTITFALILSLSFSSCNKEETYAERRERENSQINSFLQRGANVVDNEYQRSLLNVPGNIKVISEKQFFAQDTTTDVSKNEYVLFAGSGVYAQFVRRGTGTGIQNGEHTMLLCRYIEYNIATDSIRSSNLYGSDAAYPDEMSLQNNNGSLTGVFTAGVMRRFYGTQVPSGWLIPLPYLKLGRQLTANDKISKVRLIVPSTEGHSIAQNRTHPYYYEISFERNR